jgi:hypothetical protein
MKSSCKFFGVVLSGCLMLAAPGCVVMDPADEADFAEAEWADELLDEAVEDGLEQDEAAGSQWYEITSDDDEPEPEPDPRDLPDPFPK